MAQILSGYFEGIPRPQRANRYTRLISRNGSVSQIYRPNSSDCAAPSTPELRKMKSIRTMTDEDGTSVVSAAAVAAVCTEEYSYMHNMLSTCKKQGVGIK